jgi:hypothetical protein
MNPRKRPVVSLVNARHIRPAGAAKTPKRCFSCKNLTSKCASLRFTCNRQPEIMIDRAPGWQIMGGSFQLHRYCELRNISHLRSHAECVWRDTRRVWEQEPAAPFGIGEITVVRSAAFHLDRVIGKGFSNAALNAGRIRFCTTRRVGRNSRTGATRLESKQMLIAKSA